MATVGDDKVAVAGDGWLHLLDTGQPAHIVVERSAPVQRWNDPRLLVGANTLWHWAPGAQGWLGFALDER